MKVKLIVWAEVNENEFNTLISANDILNSIITNLIDYDIATDVTRTEWEDDGMDWNDEE